MLHTVLLKNINIWDQNFAVTGDILAVEHQGQLSPSSVLLEIYVIQLLFTKLFETSVSLVFEYGSEVWCYRNNVTCESSPQSRKILSWYSFKSSYTSTYW